MMSMPVCPILSIRNAEYNELCVGETCALYLTAAQRCSLVFMGFKAFVEVQRMQQQSQSPPPATQ